MRTSSTECSSILTKFLDLVERRVAPAMPQHNLHKSNPQNMIFGVVYHLGYAIRELSEGVGIRTDERSIPIDTLSNLRN